jgi:hypothetical protein
MQGLCGADAPSAAVDPDLVHSRATEVLIRKQDFDSEVRI